MTPQAPDAPIIIPPSPGSDSDANILAIAAGTSEKAQGSSAELLANDQKEWDPSFGMEPTSAPATPTNGTETAPAGGDQALSSWSKMMGDENEMMGAHEDDSDDAWGSWGASTTSAVPAEKGAGKKDRSTPLRSTGATPDDSLGGSEAEDEDPFQWLSLGAGVLYKEGGDEKQGWVFKVSPDDDDGGSVLVVPNEHCPRAGTVPLSEMKKLSLMNNELKPASLFVKGDTVAVIRGEKYISPPVRGKVMTQIAVEYMRPSGAILPVRVKISQEETIEVRKKDLALFSTSWEKAAVEGTVPDEESEIELFPVEAPTTNAEHRDRADAIRAALANSQRRVAAAVEPVPVAESPVTVAEDTPNAVSVGDTATVSETPTSDGSSMFGDTPSSVGGTPLHAPLGTRGRTSRLPLPSRQMPGMPGFGTPSPAPGGEFTPSTPAGGEFTPVPGGVTPMLPGVSTPVPGGVTPQLGGASPTPFAGGETPQSQIGGTPLVAPAVPGALTPVPGAVTPDPGKIGGAMTPGAASSSGGGTPKSNMDDDKAEL